MRLEWEPAMSSTTKKAGGVMFIFPEWIDKVVTAILGAVVAVLTLRRKVSTDSAGIAEDGVKTTMLQAAVAREEAAMARAGEAWQIARDAWEERTQDREKIARLEAFMEMKDARIKDLEDKSLALRVRVVWLTQKLLKLDPKAGDELLNLEAIDGYDNGPFPHLVPRKEGGGE